MREDSMKKKGNSAFTLVELIAVVAILSILLCIAVPNMMNYIEAAHMKTAQTESQVCADAVQRYLHDELEKGPLSMSLVMKLMNLSLAEPDGPLVDYMSGGQKDSRISAISVDLYTGQLISLDYETKKYKVTLECDDKGNMNLVENGTVKLEDPGMHRQE